MYHPEYIYILNAPEHSGRNKRLQLTGNVFDRLHPTEYVRLITINHVVAHGLNDIRAVDTLLESAPFIVYGNNAHHEEARGDIRDPDALKSLLNEEFWPIDDGGYFPE